MRVLLLSPSRVVQELVKLGIVSLEGVELDIARAPGEVGGDRYDVLLLDDRYLAEEAGDPLEHLLAGKKVLLGTEKASDFPYFDTVLEKPFLPEEIRRLIEGAPEEGARASSLSLSEERRASTEVLDEEEIRKIRSLLDDEGAEVGEISPSPERLQERAYTFEDLLDLLERQKVKKLKKLLRGAKIHISIQWPEGEE
ncbi:hypothetical protein [Nitratifractor sp.]